MDGKYDDKSLKTLEAGLFAVFGNNSWYNNIVASGGGAGLKAFISANLLPVLIPQVSYSLSDLVKLVGDGSTQSPNPLLLD